MQEIIIFHLGEISVRHESIPTPPLDSYLAVSEPLCSVAARMDGVGVTARWAESGGHRLPHWRLTLKGGTVKEQAVATPGFVVVVVAFCLFNKIWKT